MSYKPNLILDNGAHKCSVTVDGKQQKITIAPFDEMSITLAKEIIRQVSDIMNAKYSFIQIIKLLDVSENLPYLSRYSQKALHITLKLLHQEEWREYIGSNTVEKISGKTKNSLVILNIGCTSAGKTLGNLHAIIPRGYIKKFIQLTTIKESTNFSIDNCVNPNNRDILNKEEFEVEFTLKTFDKAEEDIVSLVIEALQEILDTIKSEVKSNDSSEVIWDIAMAAACERLTINKDKTFDISNLVDFDNENIVLEAILLKGIREYSTRSISYRDKLTDNQLKLDIVRDIKENVFKITIDDIAYIICETQDFKKLTKHIHDQVYDAINKFSVKYDVSINYGQTISIKKRFDAVDTKDLISNVFGDKKQRKNNNFFSIDALISKAKLYFRNNEINNGEELTVVDGLGINQGQIPKGEEKKVAYNRVHAAIQQCNPDVIIYNTRLDSKDDYIIDVIQDLNDQGFKNRIYVIYGRVDIVLENHCDEDGLDIEDLSDTELASFEDYIEKQYLNKELISLGNLERSKVYLCDKPCKLSIKYSNEQFEKYTPKRILTNILEIYRENERTELIKLNKARIDQIISTLDNYSVFSNTYAMFKASIDVMVPMQYSLLRWNTLECGVRSLYYDGLGYASLYPSIVLKNCFAKQFNRKEIQAVFGDDYDDILKALLNDWTNLAHLIIVTFYKYEFAQLLNMRFNYELRTMKSITLTDERKHIVRNILNTCVENDDLDGPSAFRKLTQYVLSDIIY
ncbi:hypothetical protein [Paenibacillus sp. FSL R7-0652]|uniref:hypothetical protein n=1 Tax=Paenibacillus sp. FSL R7-0652 TaxID=2921687 RepID=UPI00315A57BA